MENKSKTYSYISVKFSSLWVKLCECLTSVLVHAPLIKLAQFNLIYESTIMCLLTNFPLLLYIDISNIKIVGSAISQGVVWEFLKKLYLTKASAHLRQ